jgi:uncharacterized Zn-finger protein
MDSVEHVPKDFARPKSQNLGTYDKRAKFGCDQCKKRFSSKRYLKHYFLTHESKPNLNDGYKCDKCGKDISSKGNLKKHMLTNESNSDLRKPFKCKCNKGFPNKSNLKLHILTHESNPDLKKAFKCGECNIKLI